MDDSEDNVAGALSFGMQAVLFPRPWNHAGLTIPETLTRLAELVRSPDRGMKANG